MKRDLGRFTIDKLIVHEVPRKIPGGGEEQPQPILSEVESAMTPGLKNYFQERIVGSLTTVRLDVIYDATLSSPVPALVLDSLGPRTSDFVDISRAMATHLHACQTAASPGGLLTVIAGGIEGLPAFGIMKLEKEEGVRLSRDDTTGKRTFNIEHIHDLMLTERTKVFKVGLFVQEGDGLATLEGAVSDKQIGSQSANGVARFFLSDFLGFKPREAPDVTTRNFFHATENFINEVVRDPSAKAKYHIALLAEVGSAAATLAPRAFATNHLLRGDQQAYIEHLDAAGVPTTEFPKDKALVASYLKRTRFDFHSGIVLFGPPAAVKEHVTVSTRGDEGVRVTIDDRLKKVRSKG